MRFFRLGMVELEKYFICQCGENYVNCVDHMQPDNQLSSPRRPAIPCTEGSDTLFEEVRVMPS